MVNGQPQKSCCTCRTPTLYPMAALEDCTHCKNYSNWFGPAPSTDLSQSTATVSATSDGSSADYYKLPPGATELQDLISYRDMNAQLGEIFRACYRYGRVSHSPKERDLKKIIFYAQAELARLAKLQVQGESK